MKPTQNRELGPLQGMAVRQGRFGLVLLAWVILGITWQLATGFSLWVTGDYWLLPLHIYGGFVTLAGLILEIGWLLLMPSGRLILQRFTGQIGFGLRRWIAILDGLILLFGTLTAFIGPTLLLTDPSWQQRFDAHRGLAALTGLLWLAHTGLSLFYVWQQRRQKIPG